MFATVVGFLVFFVLIPVVAWVIFKFMVRPMMAGYERLKLEEQNSKLRHQAFSYRYIH